ncbi:hypothetical protein K439DRAFT_1616892 [Ramaria rubella]|nr:hypothetical protein K439DRAFT_1616892 [Ramaria rubella]
MNNYIESWHSNLKWNYLHNIRRQHIDYLIRILAEDLEADYMHTHVRIGRVFAQRAFFKAEQEGRRLAEGLDTASAEHRVRVISETSADVFYSLEITGNAIMSCSCAAFSHSRLRMTTFIISLVKTVLPPMPLILPNPVCEAQRQEKRRLIVKIKTALTHLNNDTCWHPVHCNRGVDEVSREGLTKILSAMEGLSHLQGEVLLNKPDYMT